MESSPSDRIVPLIVATALYMENMVSTSLPAIAQALGTNPLALTLAVTSYLLSLVSVVAGDLHPGQRLDRRPVRHPQRVPRRDRCLRAGLDRLRRLALARGIRAGPHRAGRRRRDDDAGRPADHGAWHRQAAARQRHGARHHHPGADRTDLRPAARRLHHDLRIVALDFFD